MLSHQIYITIHVVCKVREANASAGTHIADAANEIRRHLGAAPEDVFNTGTNAGFTPVTSFLFCGQGAIAIAFFADEGL
jgi:hypothetical protein